MMRAWLLCCALLASGAALAHSINSAQWQLIQRDAQTWDSRLRLPEDFEGRLLALQPSWPTECRVLNEPQQQPADEAMVLRWTLDCPSGLRGAVGLNGFSIQLPDAVLQVQPLGGEATYAVLSASQPQWQIQDAPRPPVAHYLGLGVQHIALGADHLLFVFGLWALWRRGGQGLRQLILVLTAFTVAHSITLSGAALAGWQLPARMVEACIAASILLLAVELATGAQGIAARQPARLAFTFGLLHGFGFAGALADIGLPEQAQAWALAAFNLGVELGQIAFVLLLMALARLASPVQRWAPVAICMYGSVASYWLIERSALLWG